MPPPSASYQLQFLTDIQRLLAEGLFTATYKFALLASLADLSVELGEDSDVVLSIPTQGVAEKFVEYYWGHVRPYASASTTGILRQNTGSPAKILTLVLEAQTMLGSSLPLAKRNRKSWTQLVRRVETVVKAQPLWKLQTVGAEKLRFLYGPSDSDDFIRLLPGVAYCFREFYSLVQDLVRGAWLRNVRSLNGSLLGESIDLRDLLFGSERGSIAASRSVLMELQESRCFYCESRIMDSSDVDHFIPWSRYPVDLAHNFVLADRKCNSAKKDRVPHVDHLKKWCERNHAFGSFITDRLDTRLICDLESARRIAFWSYSQTERANALTWLSGETLVHLAPSWKGLLASWR